MRYSIKSTGILWMFFSLSSSVFAQEMKQEESYAQFIQKRRTEKDSVFLSEFSPLTQEMIPSFKGLEYFPADQKYQVNALLSKFEPPKRIKIQNTQGKPDVFLVFGQLNFSMEQKNLSLTVYQREKDLSFPNPLVKKRLFLPFRDLSNGVSTYSGGRYLDLFLPEKGNEIMLDFNQAYNPYCAYNPEYTCPIPPKENTLPIAIEAGEKIYLKEFTHKILKK